MSRHILTLSPDYVQNWNTTDAVRELFQNARDQEVTQKGNKMFFVYDKDSETLSIGNKKSVLEVQSLLLGKSTKRDSVDTVGKFGEGYKIASLVLLRLGKKLTFYNYGAREVWTPKLVKSRTYKTTVLAFDIDKKFIFTAVPDNDLTIKVEGITASEYDDIVEHNLHCQKMLGKTLSTSKGTILKDERFKGKVFVGGLYVCEYEQYHFGYDFKPAYIKIDRDRKLVSDWDLKWLASEMWCEADADEVAQFVSLGYTDVACVGSQIKYGFGQNMRNISEKTYEAFKAKHGVNAVPVTTQSEVDNYKSNKAFKPIVVSDNEKQVITSADSYAPPVAEQKPPKKHTNPIDDLDKWFERVKKKLTKKEYLEFKSIQARITVKGS